MPTNQKRTGRIVPKDWIGKRSAVISWVLVVIYAIGIFTLSAMSKPPVPPGSENVPDFSYLVHFTEYAVFAMLLFFAFRSVKNESVMKQYEIYALLAAVIYGASDEFHQSFVPGRDMSIYDFLTDSSGAACMILILTVYYIIYRYRKNNRV